jgi:hypothetical protein
MKKKLIRKAVFETNSSSTHSLVVSDATDFDSIAPDDNGFIIVPQNDFGWATDTYSDPLSKLSYVMIYLRDWTDYLDADRKIAYEEMLIDVVNEHTGAFMVQLAETNDPGYIDHQSVESRDLDYLFNDRVAMKNFVFGRNSYVETGNDNG